MCLFQSYTLGHANQNKMAIKGWQYGETRFPQYQHIYEHEKVLS